MQAKQQLRGKPLLILSLSHTHTFSLLHLSLTQKQMHSTVHLPLRQIFVKMDTQTGLITPKFGAGEGEEKEREGGWVVKE